MIPFGLMYLIGCTEDNDISNKPIEESIITDIDGDGYMSDEDFDKFVKPEEMVSPSKK